MHHTSGGGEGRAPPIPFYRTEWSLKLFDLLAVLVSSTAFSRLNLAALLLLCVRGSKVKLKLGAYAMLRVAAVPLSVSVSLELVVGKNPPTRGHRTSVTYEFPQFTFPRFPPH